MSARTEADRKLIGSLAASTRWGRVADATAETAKPRSLSPSSVDYWLAKVDELHPGVKLSQRDRERAAGNLKSAHFKRMALKSAQARRKAAS